MFGLWPWHCPPGRPGPPTLGRRAGAHTAGPPALGTWPPLLLPTGSWSQRPILSRQHRWPLGAGSPHGTCPVPSVLTEPQGSRVCSRPIAVPWVTAGCPRAAPNDVTSPICAIPSAKHSLRRGCWDTGSGNGVLVCAHLTPMERMGNSLLPLGQPWFDVPWFCASPARVLWRHSDE